MVLFYPKTKYFSLGVGIRDSTQIAEDKVKIVYYFLKDEKLNCISICSINQIQYLYDYKKTAMEYLFATNLSVHVTFQGTSLLLSPLPLIV